MNIAIKVIIVLLVAILTYIVFNTLYDVIHREDTIKNKIAILIGTIILEMIFIITILIMILLIK